MNTSGDANVAVTEFHNKKSDHETAVTQINAYSYIDIF